MWSFLAVAELCENEQLLFFLPVAVWENQVLYIRDVFLTREAANIYMLPDEFAPVIMTLRFN